MFFPTSLSAFAALVVTCSIPGQALADSTALYDEAAPADAVFVRLLQTEDTTPETITFGGQRLSTDALQSDTYVAISASQLSDTAPGGFYSLVASDASLAVIQEPARATASKVQLLLLNASNEPVRLTLPSRGAEVISAVQPDTAASRAVNPVSVALAVERVSDGAILGAFDVSLARGKNLTFVADLNGARLIENRFGSVLKVK